MTEKRFKTVLATYEDGKLLHKFTVPDDSAEAAVQWAYDRAITDARWADERAESKPRYDARIVSGAHIRWTPKGSVQGFKGVVKKINSETLRARVRLDGDQRDVSIMLKNLEFLSAPEEKFSPGDRVRFTERARKTDFYGGRQAPSGVFYVQHYAHDGTSPHEDLFLGTSREGGSIGRWAQAHLEAAE